MSGRIRVCVSKISGVKIRFARNRTDSWRVKKARLPCTLSALILLACFSSASSAAPLMVEKNLFSKNRKPFSQEPYTAGRALSLLPRWVQLDGIMIHDEEKKALIRLRRRSVIAGKAMPNSRFHIVREGESVGDYKVVRINRRAIWLQRMGVTYEVLLFSNDTRVLASALLPRTPDSRSGGESGE